MREGCIGEQNNRIGKWKMIRAISEQEASGAES